MDYCFSTIHQKWAGNLLGDTVDVDVPIQRYHIKRMHFLWAVGLDFNNEGLWRNVFVQGSHREMDASIPLHKRFNSHNTKGTYCLTSHQTCEQVLKISPNQCIFYCVNSTGQGFIESLTPGALPLATDKDPIRLLDLSGNELSNLSCLMDVSSLKRQMENLLRLDLSSNSLSEFPSVLCQVCGNILTVLLKLCVVKVNMKLSSKPIL